MPSEADLQEREAFNDYLFDLGRTILAIDQAADASDANWVTNTSLIRALLERVTRPVDNMAKNEHELDNIAIIGGVLCMAQDLEQLSRRPEAMEQDAKLVMMQLSRYVGAWFWSQVADRASSREVELWFERHARLKAALQEFTVKWHRTIVVHLELQRATLIFQPSAPAAHPGAATSPVQPTTLPLPPVQTPAALLDGECEARSSFQAEPAALQIPTGVATGRGRHEDRGPSQAPDLRHTTSSRRSLGVPDWAAAAEPSNLAGATARDESVVEQQVAPKAEGGRGKWRQAV